MLRYKGRIDSVNSDLFVKTLLSKCKWRLFSTRDTVVTRIDITYDEKAEGQLSKLFINSSQRMHGLRYGPWSLCTTFFVCF